jgi:hypothetical protein
MGNLSVNRISIRLPWAGFGGPKEMGELLPLWGAGRPEPLLTSHIWTAWPRSQSDDQRWSRALRP